MLTNQGVNSGRKQETRHGNVEEVSYDKSGNGSSKTRIKQDNQYVMNSNENGRVRRDQSEIDMEPNKPMMPIRVSKDK